MNKALLAVPLISVLALAGCASPEQPFTLFDDAKSTCGVVDGITVSDKGETLTLEMMGETDWVGADYYAIECMIGAVDTPSFIKDSMYSTRALDGRQSAEYDLVVGGEGTDFAETTYTIEVQWSYHPDSGLDLVYHYVAPKGE